MALLEQQQIQDGLARLEGWEWDPESNEIRRTVAMPSFMSGINLVTSVAHVAEQADHHPDMDIRFNRITFHQTTHAAGGVTQQDLDMASRIDELVSDAAPTR
ncbi:4a-hydroxytetrahydrobiopterin dehydratase [Haloactinospora alba]|uniref:Putative pterin-4-alpha-carbinolamine dehydratase n=1 Tax=Haloactinospora alba TaxID=405555 RepID=A0A543NIQ5_9ACTN|nr:4a-hydroxytetrahydrobiopterin dehydratase [Haloactinospora alba]TQN31718.1 4a-hydroxytetrahydrobiopterin dehydratase [Haloactinospora alba]